MAYDYDRRLAYNDRPPITIECEVADTDGVKSVIRVLQFLQWCGDVGASRGLSCDKKHLAGFDGDGADRINEIRVNGKVVKYDKKLSKEFDDISN